MRFILFIFISFEGLLSFSQDTTLTDPIKLDTSIIGLQLSEVILGLGTTSNNFRICSDPELVIQAVTGSLPDSTEVIFFYDRINNEEEQELIWDRPIIGLGWADTLGNEEYYGARLLLYRVRNQYAENKFNRELNENLDELDYLGEKSGYWTVYMDANFQQTEIDSALYIGYEYYENGELINSFKNIKCRPNWTVERIPNPFYSVEDRRVLDGLFRVTKTSMTFLGLGQVNTVNWIMFRNGLPYYTMEIMTDVNGQNVSSRITNFARKDKGRVGSYYYEFQKNGSIQYAYWFTERGKGWRRYKIQGANPNSRREAVDEMMNVYNELLFRMIAG